MNTESRREFEEYWEKGGVTIEPPILQLAFKEVAQKTWRAARERQDNDLTEARKEAEKYRNFYSNTTIERYAKTKAGHFNLPWEKPNPPTKAPQSLTQ